MNKTSNLWQIKFKVLHYRSFLYLIVISFIVAELFKNEIVHLLLSAADHPTCRLYCTLYNKHAFLEILRTIVENCQYPWQWEYCNTSCLKHNKQLLNYIDFLIANVKIVILLQISKCNFYWEFMIFCACWEFRAWAHRARCRLFHSWRWEAQLWHKRRNACYMSFIRRGCGRTFNCVRVQPILQTNKI